MRKLWEHGLSLTVAGFYSYTFWGSSVIFCVVSVDLLDGRLFFTFSVSSFDSKRAFRAWMETTLFWRLPMDLLRAKLVLAGDWSLSSFPLPRASRWDTLVSRVRWGICGDIWGKHELAMMFYHVKIWEMSCRYLLGLCLHFDFHIFPNVVLCCHLIPAQKVHITCLQTQELPAEGYWAVMAWSPGNQLGHRCGSIP